MALEKFSYVKTLGAFKPAFMGMPEDYFPLTNWEVFKYTLFVLGVIGGTLGIMIGLLLWAIGGLSKYILVWGIVTLCFVVTLIILFFVGGRRRIRDEKSLI